MVHIFSLAASPTSLPADCEEIGVHVQSIPDGDAGIYETLRIMQAIVEAGMVHPLVRQHAERAVTGLSHSNPEAEVRAVAEYILARVDYRPDPTPREWLQTPWRVLHCAVDQGQRPQVDCDDLVDLSLSMLGSIGHEVNFLVVSTLPTQALDHVLGLVELRGAWVPFDLTGMPPSAWTRAEVFPA